MSDRGKIGRPAAKPGTKRVQIAARVAPETARYLAAAQERTGKSLSVILDEAVTLHQERG